MFENCHLQFWKFHRLENLSEKYMLDNAYIYKPVNFYHSVPHLFDIWLTTSVS